MPGRPCSICTNAENIRIAAEMIAAGATDQAIADRLGIGRMSVQRHRHAHVVKPAKALAEAAGKGRDAVEQRARVLAAAEAGDPSAFVALAGIVADLRRVNERLERTAAAAEGDNQRLAVSSLSAQQLRAAEVRAKLGAVGSYGVQKSPAGADAPVFSLMIHLGEQTTRIEALPDHPEEGRAIEGEATQLPPSAEEPEPPSLAMPRFLPVSEPKAAAVFQPPEKPPEPEENSGYRAGYAAAAAHAFRVEGVATKVPGPGQ